MRIFWSTVSNLADRSRSPSRTWLPWSIVSIRSAYSDFQYCRLSGVALSVCRLVTEENQQLLGTISPDISMTSHINKVVGQSFRQSRLIKSGVRSLTFESARTLVNSFVISRIDNSNGLLTGLPKILLVRMQTVLNASVKLLCDYQKYDHVTPLIRDRLHWLLVPQRIEFKLSLLTFKSLRGSVAPRYLADLCCSTSVVESGHNLRSPTKGDFHVSRMCPKFGDRSFTVAGPRTSMEQATNEYSFLWLFRSV